DQELRVLFSGLAELGSISEQAKRPEFTEDMGEQLMDSNPALPCLLAAFSPGDAVVGCFDDEAQTAIDPTSSSPSDSPIRLLCGKVSARWAWCATRSLPPAG